MLCWSYMFYLSLFGSLSSILLSPFPLLPTPLPPPSLPLLLTQLPHPPPSHPAPSFLTPPPSHPAPSSLTPPPSHPTPSSVTPPPPHPTPFSLTLRRNLMLKVMSLKWFRVHIDPPPDRHRNWDQLPPPLTACSGPLQRRAKTVHTTGKVSKEFYPTSFTPPHCYLVCSNLKLFLHRDEGRSEGGCWAEWW